MNRVSRAACAAVLAACSVAALAAEPPKSNEEVAAAMRALPWEAGPTVAQVGSRSKVAIPKDVGFLKESAGSRFLELMGNLPSPGTSILMGRNWWEWRKIERKYRRS